ncbi:MAG TPA: hypothetical protein DDW21_09420 [Verrucomicrobiales bacterium]|nr:hypothetical protein [Verrucomicrobiales bacterium]
MEAARLAARGFVADGIIEISQGVCSDDSSHARGPIRLRRSKNFPPIC